MSHNRIRGKVFSIVQQEKFLKEETIREAVKYNTIKKWTYVLHDKDQYSDYDEENEIAYLEAFYHNENTHTTCKFNDLSNNEQALFDRGKMPPEAFIQKYKRIHSGNLKPAHWHVTISCPNKQFLDVIARWFDVPPNYVEVRKGPSAFLDSVEYSLHESPSAVDEGKYHYDDCDMKSNFDFRSELNQRKEDELKYGKSKTTVEMFIVDVIDFGKSLKECKREMDSNDYINCISKLKIARAEYLDKKAELPNTRITIYVSGKGGVGKGILCELLARALCSFIPDTRDIIFGIGDSKVTFDGYDGEPVILWQDIRAKDLISKLDRNITLKALEPHPRLGDGNVNIKYGKTRLIHQYNIINSVEPFDEFIQHLSKGYNDINIEQFYRRFPIIITVDEEKYDIFVNVGVFTNTSEYSKYGSYASMTVSFRKIQELCGDDQDLLIKMSKQMIDPIVNVSEYLKKKSTNPIDENYIKETISSLGYGKITQGDFSLECQDDSKR